MLVHNNQGLANFRKALHAGTVIEKNIHFFKKGELEVREQSNSLFLGWTKPIQLPGKGAIPPSGLLFEGYGDARTNSAKVAINNRLVNSDRRQ